MHFDNPYELVHSALTCLSCAGYWTVHEKVRRPCAPNPLVQDCCQCNTAPKLTCCTQVRQVQHQIQEINATTRYSDQWSMAEALLEREVLRKQLPVVTGMHPLLVYN